ncbi:hypothetical protein FKR81_42350 [Lentzea tibetensis]|uniref:Uncharacterized protein n=1 Tax=Lentzea tibetensis TaxID=2591470 RepID=A0A563EEY4_9PSEU|nr:hypothetical protein [Lentzea tibetensis]TWP43513.1 hypothetical protein FKR81_42350 [Lentzea tibetensis]
MTDRDNTTAAGGDPTRDDYFTEEERAGLEHWRAIVADMPPMTQDEIERVAAIFRRTDARRNTK